VVKEIRIEYSPPSEHRNNQGLTLCGGVLVNVDFTCRKSVRLVMSNLRGHLQQLAMELLTDIRLYLQSLMKSRRQTRKNKRGNSLLYRFRSGNRIFANIRIHSICINCTVMNTTLAQCSLPLILCGFSRSFHTRWF
jgi:hypothetical protein